MKLFQRIPHAVAGTAIACCVHAADSPIQLNAKPALKNQTATQQSAARSLGADETNSSPRERGRILVKRNPIASEYQVFGDLGSSPGADADAEGVDYRAYFPTHNPLDRSSASFTVGASLNYNNLSGIAEPGAELSFTKPLSDRWTLSAQFRSNASDRLIEHYEAVWKPYFSDSSDPLFQLDRPRYSFDSIFTRNQVGALQIGHQLTENHAIYFKTYYQDYFDNSYRNRIEYQVAAGVIDPSSIDAKEDGSIIKADVTNARTRRYFGDTDNTRSRQHTTFGGSYEGSVWNVDYSVYSQKWDLDRTWYNWNFNDTGVDLSYDASSIYFPIVESSNLDPTNQETARFSSVRIHDNATRDRDLVGRIDAERRLEIGERAYWIQTGLLWRQKERAVREGRDVFTADSTNPFNLDQVAYDQPAGTILDGRYELQSGLDPLKGRQLIASNPELFAFSSYRSELESLPQAYDAEETVTSSYILGLTQIDDWSIEAGLRYERTETATRGTNSIPEAVNDPDEGAFLKELIDPNNGDVYVIKDLYSGNSYDNLLPSVEIGKELSRESSIKASYFQLLMRPQYFNIVDYRRISVPTQSISEGNPLLQPTLIDNFRLAWTIENERIGAFSAEAYLIEIENFFYGAVSTESILENGDAKDYRVSRVENGDSGTIKGLQLQWKKSLQGPLFYEKGDLSLAYTYSDSEAQVATRSESMLVPERSEHLLKATFSGSVGKLRNDLTVTYQSAALDDVGTNEEEDVYRKAFITTSLNTSYQLSDGRSLYLRLSNLTNHPERSFENSPYRVSRNQYSSWIGVFGFRQRF
ncbi:outer membrane beta-barrel protein [Pelagicoccus sp. SDUM812003]|uniref:outer membrane beta-barrel protein n=1 Tax=Pelagicoccus sp. SDUM812003 TaxID=3041267 RepID=UPI00280D1453|nr:outer membrane beta-barrel protein [Pelagicoccus sp. SDUM812003]MDQ8204064.1 outer membrane beta-barrel protein [Pelagicoccus sp. SDUM812003]